MTVTYSFFVQTAIIRTPAELMKASNPVPPGVKKLNGIKLRKEVRAGDNMSIHNNIKTGSKIMVEGVVNINVKRPIPKY